MFEASSPTTRQNQLLVLLILALHVAAIWLGGWLFFVWAMILVLPVAIRGRYLPTVHLALVFLAVRLVPDLFRHTPTFLVERTSGLLVYLYLAFMIIPLRRTLTWLRAGRANPAAVILALVFAGISALGLMGWVHFMHPSMDLYAQNLPHLSPLLLPLYMGVFALINALVEEIIWRGVALTALDAAFGAGSFSLLAQAAVFGMAHYLSGFPRGWVGAFLAALFGLGMGWLRRLTHGLLIPWLSHAFTDFVIICLIVHYA